MKFWFDANVTPTLEGVAHARGYEATSCRTRGMLDALDPDLYLIVVAEDWVFVTNNEKDFVGSAIHAALHPGLVALPQGVVAKQRASFDEVISYIEQRAAAHRETPADWMVCRVVEYEDDGTIGHGWLPDPAAM